jgi:hypothetical protein
MGRAMQSEGLRPPSGGRSNPLWSARHRHAPAGMSVLNDTNAPSRGGGRARPGLRRGQSARTKRQYQTGEAH